MSVWRIDWPAAANADDLDEDTRYLAEEYAGQTMVLLTLGRVGGDDFTAADLGTTPVDALGARAGGVLAVEFLKLLTSDKKCRLPSSVTNVSRQGLTFEVTRGMWPEGKTSIPEVDAYLMLWNPHGLKTRPRVWVPDEVAASTNTFGVF